MNYESKDENGKDISRLSAMKDAAKNFIEEKANQKEEVKVGIVTFNSEVTVIGDGSNIQQAEDYVDDNFDKLFEQLTKTDGSLKNTLKLSVQESKVKLI